MTAVSASVDDRLEVLAAGWMACLLRGCPADWRELLPALDLSRPDRQLAPNALPVLSYLDPLIAQAPEAHRGMVACLADLKSDLHFNQTYSAEDFGADFLQQYGWVKLLGPDGYWHSDMLSSGFLLLGDNVTYPEHWHEAEELYFPISGTGDWFHEDHGWQRTGPGGRIEHASNVKHAMRSTG